MRVTDERRGEEERGRGARGRGGEASGRKGERECLLDLDYAFDSTCASYLALTG